jgi:hypothetical protein
MKVLQIIIFLYLYNFISDSKLNYHKNNHPKINHKHPSNDLPIQKKVLFIKQLYKQKFNGTDDRYPASENITQEEKYKIYKNIENKCKLDILQNEYISIYDKLQLLNDRSIQPHNLAEGGLMDDYEFEL